jgi:hypothetical protein
MTETAWHVLLLVVAGAFIVESLVLVGILRQVGAILMQIGPIRHGEIEEGPAPGTEVAIPGLASGRPALIAFVSPSCELCQPVTAALPHMRRLYPEIDIIPAVVGSAPQEDKEALASKMGGGRLDLSDLFDDWKLPGTPFAVGISREGLVETRGIINNLPQFEHVAELLIAALSEDESNVDSPDGDMRDLMEIGPFESRS